MWCFNMHIYIPYTWKQELHISFNPTYNFNASNTQNFQWKFEERYVTFPDDLRTETYQKERKQ